MKEIKKKHKIFIYVSRIHNYHPLTTNNHMYKFIEMIISHLLFVYVLCFLFNLI